MILSSAFTGGMSLHSRWCVDMCPFPWLLLWLTRAILRALNWLICNYVSGCWKMLTNTHMQWGSWRPSDMVQLFPTVSCFFSLFAAFPSLPSSHPCLCDWAYIQKTSHINLKNQQCSLTVFSVFIWKMHTCIYSAHSTLTVCCSNLCCHWYQGMEVLVQTQLSIVERHCCGYMFRIIHRPWKN